MTQAASTPVSMSMAAVGIRSVAMAVRSSSRKSWGLGIGRGVWVLGSSIICNFCNVRFQFVGVMVQLAALSIVSMFLTSLIPLCSLPSNFLPTMSIN